MTARLVHQAPSMDAFSVADELLGGIELSSGQLTQLRAINYKYWVEVARLLRAPGDAARAPGLHPQQPTASMNRELTEGELAGLRAMLVSDIREMLTIEQRNALDPS